MGAAGTGPSNDHSVRRRRRSAKSRNKCCYLYHLENGPAESNSIITQPLSIKCFLGISGVEYSPVSLTNKAVDNVAVLGKPSKNNCYSDSTRLERGNCAGHTFLCGTQGGVAFGGKMFGAFHLLSRSGITSGSGGPSLTIAPAKNEDISQSRRTISYSANLHTYAQFARPVWTPRVNSACM